MTLPIRLRDRLLPRRRTRRLLREAEERYRMLVERAPVCILGIDRTARIVSINAVGLEMMRMSREEAIGLSYLDCVTPADRSRVATFLSQAFEGQSCEFEFRSIEDERAFASSFIPVPARDGEVSSLIGVTQDITGRRRSEKALRESEARLRALIEASPVAIVELDPDLTVRLCNAAAESLFGWSAEELRGRYLPTVPEDNGRETAFHHARVLEGEAVGFQARRLRRDGTTVDVEVFGGPIVDQHGTVTGVVAVYTDVSERTRTEAALRRSEERYRELFENASEMIVTTDLESRIVAVNRTAERLSGYERSELMGRHLDAFVSPETLERARAHAERIRAGERDSSPLLAIRCAGGNEAQIEMSARVILEGGEPIGLQWIGRDVSERLRLEAQLRQAQKMEAVGRLAGGIAHDFNNLLTAISGYADLALLDVPPDATGLKEDIGEVIRAAERASTLTQQLLAFSRSRVVHTSRLDLAALLAGLEGMLRRLSGEDVALSLRLGDEPCWVEGDPSGLEQVVLNLVVNARDAMPHGGRLEIELDVVELDADAAAPLGLEQAEYVRLTVADDGCGMDDDVRAHVFEPFFTTKEQGKGTGLGLATVYGVIEKSEGAVTIDSAPGRGTTVTVHLPRRAAAVPRPAVPAVPDARGGAETILLVEDDDMVRELARRVLAAAGYDVLEARFGSEAISMCGRRDGPLDLLVTDMVMPGMGGGELAERLERLQPGMRRLFISGYSRDAAGRPGLDAASDPFLGKPFSPDELVHKVRQVLDSRA